MRSVRSSVSRPRWGGWLGVSLGGALSDRLKLRAANGRLWVGWITAALSLPTGWIMLHTESLILAYVMNFLFSLTSPLWLGAAASAVNELVLPRLRALASAFYILLLTFIGLALGPVYDGAALGHLRAGRCRPGRRTPRCDEHRSRHVRGERGRVGAGRALPPRQRKPAGSSGREPPASLSDRPRVEFRVVPFPRRRFLKLALSVPFASLGAPAQAKPERVDAFGVQQATRNTRLGSLNPAPLFGSKPLPYKRYADRERESLAKVGLESRPLAGVVPSVTPATAFHARCDLARSTLGAVALHERGHRPTGRKPAAGVPARRPRPPVLSMRARSTCWRSGSMVSHPGLYAFQPREHALVPLREGPLLRRVGAALENPGAVANAAAVVLLTNVFQRYKWKYRGRGYRYALSDSGHIAENLRLASAGAGLGVASPLRFQDDVLNALLGQDGRREAVCALLALGHASEWGRCQ